MATAQDVLNVARKYIGVKENPAGSNNVVFNTLYYGREVSGNAYPWCCVFIWHIFNEAGASNLFFGGEKTAYCPTLYSYYKRNNQLVSNPQSGDIVFYMFNSSAIAHVGIVETNNGDGTVTTIEGNTSASSDDNGGAVQRRIRKLSQCYAFARPAYGQNVVPVNKVIIKDINKIGIITASKLNIRVSYGTTSSVIGTYSKGEQVQLVGEASNGWYQTDKGWISGQYVTIKETDKQPMASSVYPQVGIDVSSYQRNMNYKQLKASGVQFCWPRIIMKNQSKDAMFETHYQGCLDAGIVINMVYDYTYATNVEYAKAEAYNVLGYLNGRRLAVCLDVEDPSLRNLGSGLVDIINAYQSVIEKAGLKFIGYTGEYFFNTYIKPYLSNLKCKNWWIAAYRNGYNEMTIHDIPDESRKPLISGVNVIAWQYTSSGKINGYNGPLDMNRLYENIADMASSSSPVFPISQKPTPYTNPAFANYPLLKYGAKGVWVTLLQNGLKARGLNINVDGVFGDETLNAVKEFQKQQGLTVDGEVGIYTYSALFR